MSYSAIYVTQTGASSFENETGTYLNFYRIEDGFGESAVTIIAKSAEQAIDLIKQQYPETNTLEFRVCEPAE